jgi:hypothetical protein
MVSQTLRAVVLLGTAAIAAVVLASAATAQQGVPSREQIKKDMAEDVPLFGALGDWNEALRLGDAAQEAIRGASIQAWLEVIRQIPTPESGCSTLTYPRITWQSVECVEPPEIPMVPRTSPRPFVIGSGNDVSAEVPTASFITTAIGSFDSVTGVTSISSPIGNTGGPVNGAYTLQLNTNFFASATCAGSPNPNCRGWEQFVFANDGTNAQAFIQYWLLRYNTNCPGGWNQFSFTGDTDIYCWRNNGAGSVAIPNQPITNLGQIRVTGTASATSDSVSVAVGTTVYSVNGDNSVALSAGWDTAEFGVFGYGGNSDGGGGATFNNGSTIVPRTQIFYGGTAAPNCVAQGFTGETNNLSFGPMAPGAAGPGPAVISTQSIAGGALSNCAAATSVGDTHLTTFSGMLYDFQASGDFILAEIGPDFEVQARQISGAPTWPNASVNSAVALRSGKTVATLCLQPERLVVDGNVFKPAEKEFLQFPDGVDVLRLGNVYHIRSADGHSVRAVMHDKYMNVSVGLGRWPVEVHGLLFNTQRYGLETRGGEVLKTPVSFKTLYNVYGDSWRVSPKGSLIAACGEEEVEQGNPEEPFFVRDLDDELQKRALALCAEAGVTEPALLEACAIDVVVIGDPEAAKVFVGTIPPVVVMQPTP